MASNDSQPGTGRAGRGTVLIVGSGPGLALALARRFGRDGFRIVLAARDQGRLEALAAGLRAGGVDAIGLPVDAANPQALAALVEGVAIDHGGIDLLVYNAATIRFAGLLEQRAEDVATDLMTGLGGAIIAAQAAARTMLDRGSGTIFFTGGGLSIDPWPGFVTLSAAKAGLRAVAIAMAKDLTLSPVRIGHFIVHGAITEETGAVLADRYADLYAATPSDWRSELEVRLG